MFTFIPELRAERDFNSLRQGFNQACEERPGELWVGDFLFGGFPVRIQFVGRKLKDHIVQPFSHLQINSPAKDSLRLQILLWEADEGGLPTTAEAVSERIRTKPQVFLSPNGRFVLERSLNTRLAFDRKKTTIVGRYISGEGLLVYEGYKPISRLLVEWFNDRNLPVIHAGLVARRDGGVLLAGGSGSGKSTTALICLQAGFEFLSEDYVALARLEDGTFVGHSMYNSIFLQAHQLALFPDLQAYVSANDEGDKLAINLARAFPQRIKRSVPIRALLLCEIGDHQLAYIHPSDNFEALRTLGLSSLMQIPNRGQRSLDTLASLVGSVPSYWLRLGQDLTSIPKCIDQVIEASR